MTAYNYLTIITIGLVVVGWGTRAYAEGDVTILPPPPTTNAPPSVATAPDGTPVVHKHKKKKSKTAVATATPGGAGASTSATTAQSNPTSSSSTASASSPKATASSTAASSTASHTASAQATTSAVAPATKPPATIAKAKVPTSVPVTPALPKPALPPAIPSAAGPILVQPTVPVDPPASPSVPTVETGLPIARHTPAEDPSAGGTSYSTTSYRSTLASMLPPLYQPAAVSATPGTQTYSPPTRTTASTDNFTFNDYSKKTHTYPWKRNVITTEFWIGEGGSSISATDNIGSAWDEDWRYNNHGTDTPNDRDEYAPAGHAATVNTFYVALPFNDLAYPDKARRWLPSHWHRPRKDGKEVSACKDRWVEIKNAQGDTCYAQWEDVGPLRSDHAEYVFGSEMPDTYTRAGLDVSPAVAKYLNIDGRNRYTSWRFVDDEDVPPGFWLKYEEQAVLFQAIHGLKTTSSSTSNVPIQRSIAPIDDPSQIDSNKKKVGAAKG